MPFLPPAERRQPKDCLSPESETCKKENSECLLLSFLASHPSCHFQVEDLTCALEEAMSLTEKQPENLTNGGFLVEAARSYVALVGLLSCTYQRNDSEKYSACEDTFMNIFTWLRRYFRKFFF